MLEFHVQGGTTPVVVVTVGSGEQIGSVAGELGWLRGDIQIEAGTLVAQASRCSGSRARFALTSSCTAMSSNSTSRPGEKLRTSPGQVGPFDASVTLDLTTIPGIEHKLVGPGKVWLQSITLAGLAQALSPYLVTDREAKEVGAAGVGAALLGGLLKK